MGGSPNLPSACVACACKGKGGYNKSLLFPFLPTAPRLQSKSTSTTSTSTSNNLHHAYNLQPPQGDHHLAPSLEPSGNLRNFPLPPLPHLTSLTPHTRLLGRNVHPPPPIHLFPKCPFPLLAGSQLLRHSRPRLRRQRTRREGWFPARAEFDEPC